MATKKTDKAAARSVAAKTDKPKTAKQRLSRSSTSCDMKKELAALKEQTEVLQKENTRMAEQFGKMLEQNTNLRLKVNAMLGQILKALFILGIGPDEIKAKCNQMFRKKIVAD